jgi:hypothetical protein
MSQSFLPPPIAHDETGAVRTVGVEVEFGGLPERGAADLIQRLYGGTVMEHDPHRFGVLGTALGDFQVELDLWLVHKDGVSGKGKAAFLEGWQDGLRALLGDVARSVVPCEIAGPPLPWSELARLDPLIEALREAGAAGTRSSVAYGFGMQLNPRAASLSAGYILSVLRAFLLLSDGLRAEMDIDVTRRVLPFIDRFPERYMALVLDREYRPSLSVLIDDYLAFNPTRNREFDLLPLFAWLDVDRVKRGVTQEGVKARPTFHYRLPNSDLENPDWGLAVEWNRWVAVEALAADRCRLAFASEDWMERRARGGLAGWPEASRAWLHGNPRETLRGDRRATHPDP